MITEHQMFDMLDELERRVRVRDSSQSVRLQEAKGPHGTVYIVHIENALMHDQYEIDAVTKSWIRKIIVPEPV
jgi:hypothetical protein